MPLPAPESGHTLASARPSQCSQAPALVSVCPAQDGWAGRTTVRTARCRLRVTHCRCAYAGHDGEIRFNEPRCAHVMLMTLKIYIINSYEVDVGADSDRHR